MKCPSCRTAEMTVVSEPYKYTESGLPNVTLLGVEVRVCPNCGERTVAIPRMVELHKVLARTIVAKRSRLAGPEVRFLRTYLGRSTEDFAALLGVTREHVSRWETGRVPIGAQADRLLRLLVAHAWPVRDYDVDELSTIDDDSAPALIPNVRVARARSGWELGAMDQ